MTTTTAPTTAPRTILTLSAVLDVVMLRIDQAGIKPVQIVGVSLYPRVWADDLQAAVDVQIHLDSSSGFDELVEVFGATDRNDNNGWWNALATLRDGTVVTITCAATAAHAGLVTA